MPSRMTPLRAAAAVLACLSGLLVAAALALADGEDDVSFGTGGTAFSILVDGPDDVLPTGAPYADQAPDGSVFEATLLRRYDLYRGKAPSRGFTLAVARRTATGGPATFGTAGNGIATHDFDAQYARLLDVRVLADGSVVAAIATVDDTGPGTGTGTTGTTGTTTTETETAPTATTDTTTTATATTVTEEVPGRRGSPVQQGGVVLVTFSPDGTSAVPDVHPSACLLTLAAEIAADGQAFTLATDCPGPDRLAHTADDSASTPLPEDRDAVDLTLGPDDAPYVLADRAPLLSRGATSYIDSVVLKYTAALAPAPGYQGGANRFDGAGVDVSVDGQGRAVVWHVPVIATRGGSAGRWTLGRLNADGTADTAFGTDGVAALEGEDFGPVQLPDTDGGCQDGIVDTCRTNQVKAEPDGKVLVSGPPSSGMRPERGSSFGQGGWTLARLTADGELDPTWDDDGVTATPPDGDGVKRVVFEENAPGSAALLNVGTPELQDDLKVLLPFTATTARARAADRIAKVDAPFAVGVERINATPPPDVPPTDTGTGTTTTQGPPPVPAPVQTLIPQASQTPPRTTAPSRSCRSRRTFKIRLRTGRRKGERSPIVAADVRVNGRKVAVSREARRRSTVDLKNLPQGRFEVQIRLRLADGGIVRETRRYRTCAKKVQRELGPLRTTPPRKGRG